MLMGPRSLLVLMKLGHELRSDYEHLMHDPVPEHLRPLIERLPTRWHDIIDLKAPTAGTAQAPL